MRVSVVIPTFNRRALLQGAIESVLLQTHEDLEIVVVDDGSTDGTSAMLEETSHTCSRDLVYERQENAGCAAARNRGLRLATGEAIGFLDTDDRWMPTAAESLVTELVRSGADFVYSPAIEVYEDGKERLNLPVAADTPDAFAAMHFMRTNVRNGAFMFRRCVLEHVGGLDESLRHNEDSDFIQRVSVLCRGSYSASPSVRVHHHDENKSRNRVAITEALLASSERTLRNSPQLIDYLGNAAWQRIRELENAHAEALISEGRFDDAKVFVANRDANMPLSLRLALRARSSIPIKTVHHLRALSSRATRAIPSRTCPNTAP